VALYRHTFVPYSNYVDQPCRPTEALLVILRTLYPKHPPLVIVRSSVKELFDVVVWYLDESLRWKVISFVLMPSIMATRKGIKVQTCKSVAALS